MRLAKTMAIGALSLMAAISSAMAVSAADPETCIHENMETTTIKAFDCEKQTNGIEKNYCSDCGYTSYVQVKWSHTASNDPDDIIEFKANTCGEAGYITTLCSVCKEEFTVDFPAKGEHDYVEKTTEETCRKPAMVGMFCSVCGAEDPENPAKPVEGSEPLGHEYEIDTEDEEYVAATCTEGGVDVEVCTRCGDRLVVETEALGHTAGATKYVPADCENNGRDETYCSVCNEVMYSEDLGDTDPALGHALETEVVAATCKEGGYTLTKCTREGCEYEVKSDETAIDPDGHVYGEPTTLKAKTCTTNGIIKKTCKECGNAVYELDPAAHTVDKYKVVKEATCTEEGSESGKCSVCGEEIKRVIPATGHNYVDVIDESGNTYKYCVNCGDEIHDTTCEHKNVEVLPATEATCTESGLTEGSKCADCGEILKAQEEIPALGHTEETVEGYAATCTEAGLTDGIKCSVCGEEIEAQEEIPAKGHTEITVEGYAATCTEAGQTNAIVCAVCDEVIQASETIPATGHNYKKVSGTKRLDEESGEWVVTYECSNCGDSYEGSLY